MAKINDIIREMEALLDGADLSNTPQGRQLAESYAEICQALNSSLEECRIMFNMGDLPRHGGSICVPPPP